MILKPNYLLKRMKSKSKSIYTQLYVIIILFFFKHERSFLKKKHAKIKYCNLNMDIATKARRKKMVHMFLLSFF